MYALYSLLTAAGMLLLSPSFMLRGLMQGKYLGNIPERLGREISAGIKRRGFALIQMKIQFGFMPYRSEKFLPCSPSRSN